MDNDTLSFEALDLVVIYRVLKTVLITLQDRPPRPSPGTSMSLLQSYRQQWTLDSDLLGGGPTE